MGVLDSSYIKALGVKSPGLNFFLFLVTPYYINSKVLFQTKLYATELISVLPTTLATLNDFLDKAPCLNISIDASMI